MLAPHTQVPLMSAIEAIPEASLNFPEPVSDSATPVESWGWHGRIKVIITYADGSTETEEFDNLITDAGHNLMRDVLRGTVTDGKIKYMAVGTSSTAAAAGQTAL